MKSRPSLLLVAFLPALAAYVILFLQTFAAPYQDDYHAILSFAVDYQQQPDWKTKLPVIAAHQHNDYKLIFEHLILAAELKITRHLNFLFLSILGDLTLLPIAYLLAKTYHAGLRSFLPIGFLFFALTYYETLDWAMAGLQNVPVILFSLLAIYLLSPQKQSAPSRARFVLACLAAVFAALTSANGFMLAPVGLLMLWRRRAYARALFWCLSFVVPLAAYLFHRISVPHPVNGYAYVTRPLFFLAFLGGAVPFPWSAVVCGLGVLAILLWALRSRFDLVNPVAFNFALWVLATAALVAWVRGAEGLYVASRYSIYSILLLIFCYVFLTQYLAARSRSGVARAFGVTSLVFSIAFCCAADVRAFRELSVRRRMVLTGMERYRANPAVNSPMIDPRIGTLAPQEAVYERDMLTQAIQSGILTLGCSRKGGGFFSDLFMKSEAERKD